MSVWTWLPPVLVGLVVIVSHFVNRPSLREREILRATAAAAIAERDAWPNCRLTLVVDGHPYVDATLLQLQTVHCDRNWLEPDGELPPMVLVTRPGVELTLSQVPPFLPIRTDTVPPPERTGRRRPFGG